MSTPFDISIEKIIPGGRGFAFHEGRPVFVPHVAPGDRLKVWKFRDRKSYLEALSVELLEPSPQRQTPPCPYYGHCGGCDFQHLAYEYQLLAKRDILLDALKRIGKTAVSPEQVRLTPSPPLRYRNRLQIKVAHHGQRLVWGFFEPASHRILPIDDCLIAFEPAWKFFLALRPLLESVPALYQSLTEMEVLSGDGDQFLASLHVEKSSLDVHQITSELRREELGPSLGNRSSLVLCFSDGRQLPLFGDGWVWKTVGGLEYRISAAAFFQINELLLKNLRDLAVGGSKGEMALDLYCGVGFFTLALAAQFSRVWAVEVNPAAVQDFRATVDKHELRNCQLSAVDLSVFLERHGRELGTADFILLDPPRTGLARKVVDQVAALAAREVAYVSCDPATLARDLRLFLNHGYRLTSLDLLDLFPQTHHLETVGRLRRP